MEGETLALGLWDPAASYMELGRLEDRQVDVESGFTLASCGRECQLRAPDPRSPLP